MQQYLCDLIAALDGAIYHPATLAAVEAALATRRRSASLQLVGVGGSSYAFRCRALGRVALLKVPRYEKRPLEEHWLLEHSLRKEAAILREAPCLHVPALLADDATGRFIFRTFHVGTSVEQINYPRERTAVLRALLCAARALFRAFHESSQGCYVIRDLKPRNLILSPGRRRITLVDVGSVRPESDMLSRTRSPGRIGSCKWLYWAPEQLLEQEQELDRRADYFSLGATAFFVLSGRAPYKNSDPSPDQLLSHYLAQQASVIAALRGTSRKCGVPADVVHFVEACLDPLPAQRPVDWAVTW